MLNPPTLTRPLRDFLAIALIDNVASLSGGVYERLNGFRRAKGISRIGGKFSHAATLGPRPPGLNPGPNSNCNSAKRGIRNSASH